MIQSLDGQESPRTPRSVRSPVAIPPRPSPRLTSPTSSSPRVSSPSNQSHVPPDRLDDVVAAGNASFTSLHVEARSKRGQSIRETSAQYSSIGLHLLSSDCSDDEDIIAFPSKNPKSGYPPTTTPRYGEAAHEFRGHQGVNRQQLAESIRSQEGEVEDPAKAGKRVTFHEDKAGISEAAARSQILDNQPQRLALSRRQVTPEVGQRFRQPGSLVNGTLALNDPRSTFPIRPTVKIPASCLPTKATTSPSNSQRQRPTIDVTLQTPLHILPPSSTPISPYLAAPPPTHQFRSPSPQLPVFRPPTSPFAAPSHRTSTQSSDNASIRGFEVMLEKKALFRGGEEELMVPFSPRGRPGTGAGGIGGYPRVGKVGIGRGVSGADFWKRFSVSVKLDEAEKAGKDQSWLAREQKKKDLIKRAIIITLAVIVLTIIAVVVSVVVKNNSSSLSTSPSTSVATAAAASAPSAMASKATALKS